MGTEVLRPHDCLIERRIRISPAFINHRRQNFSRNGNQNPRAPIDRKNRRRSVSLDDMRNNSSAGKAPAARKVTVLRRGQSLNDIAGIQQVSLSPSRADEYAGSTVAMSPSPRALPLPSFFSKKAASRVTGDDSATRALRRLLRLE